MPNVFPDIYPAVWEPSWEAYQERDEARDGFLQLNSYDPVDQVSAHAGWSTLSRAERDQIKAHRDANKDRSFTLFDFHSATPAAVYVATGNGVATAFTLPAKAVAGLTVTVNGAPVAVVLAAGAGTDGADRITFAAPPAAGAIIRFSATEARMRYELLYKVGTFAWRHVEADIWSIETDFIQEVAA